LPTKAGSFVNEQTVQVHVVVAVNVAVKVKVNVNVNLNEGRVPYGREG
jgi:hypothetical protein